MAYLSLYRKYRPQTFDEILGQQLKICDRTKSNLALIFLDLDGFKAVNDVHGHTAGDEVLRTVAARIVNAIRKSDLAARLGGDEFAVVLNHAGLEAARDLAERSLPPCFRRVRARHPRRPRLPTPQAEPRRESLFPRRSRV